MFKKIITLLSIFILIFALCVVPTSADDIASAQKLDVTISGTGYGSYGFLKDGNVKNYKTSSDNCTITLEAEEDIYSLYLMFDKEYGEYTITDNTNNTTITAGQYSFLHEYIKLSKPSKSLTINFENGTVKLSEITAYSDGVTPDGVQDWSAPLDGKADILLLATHGDDDQLFFAGLFPLYAAEKKCAVQVAYLTDHRNLTKGRTHEMLNGLWATGVTAYPVFGRFADFRIDDLQGTYNEYARRGTTKEDLQAYVVEQIRRFKPQVTVAHDFNGEYGHGMHMVYTDLLVKSLDITNDETQFPESAEKYGVWDIPKTYVHLYKENPIIIDYDTPLESCNGLTAFEVTKKYGYPCHESQQYTWFTDWLNKYPKAAQITTYNPCQFGLYRSTVGEDVLKNDFMENIVKYADQKVETEEPVTPESKPPVNTENNTPKEDSTVDYVLIIAIVLFAVATLTLLVVLIFKLKHK